VRVQRFADRKVWEASHAIASAAAHHDSGQEFGQAVMDAVNHVVPTDFSSIITAVPGEEWSLRGFIGSAPDNATFAANFWTYVTEMSPAEQLRLGAGLAPAEETFSLKRRDELSVFREFLTPRGLTRVLPVTWTVDGRLWGLGLTRSKAAFSSQDLGRLKLLLPHVRAAMRVRPLPSSLDDDTHEGTFSAAKGWRLTPLQMKTLNLVIRGLTNREVADLLGLSPNTVRNILVEVFRKVGVSRRSELAYMAALAAHSEAVFEGRDSPDRRAFLRHIRAAMERPPAAQDG